MNQWIFHLLYSVISCVWPIKHIIFLYIPNLLHSFGLLGNHSFPIDKAQQVYYITLPLVVTATSVSALFLLCLCYKELSLAVLEVCKEPNFRFQQVLRLPWLHQVVSVVAVSSAVPFRSFLMRCDPKENFLSPIIGSMFFPFEISFLLLIYFLLLLLIHQIMGWLFPHFFAYVICCDWLLNLSWMKILPKLP